MDRFRKNYSPITDYQKALMARIKDKAAELEELYMEVQHYSNETAKTDIPKGEYGRLISLAITDLEKSALWGAKAASTNLDQ